jgi:pilus assembly protein CpaB
MSLRSYFTSAPAAPVVAAPTAPRILVAKRNLSSGSFVQIGQDLDWQIVEGGSGDGKSDADKTLDKAKYQYEDSVKMESLAGAVVRRPIHLGEPILASDLMKSGDGGFLSAVLGEGMRAVTSAVNVTSGNAGFISPADRVDLLLTHHIQNGGKSEQVVTETFARDVRVLAVDQALENPENKAILAKTVTLEVTPLQAEQISVAAELGKISVSLVSTALSNFGQNSPTMDAKPISNDRNNSSAQPSALDGISKVRVIRGDKMETIEFYQDVK